jgi:hypothetical protein
MEKPSFNSLARIFWIIPFLVLPFLTSGAAAQDAEDEPWTPPVNLSNSGSTSNPVVVADSFGMIHVVWMDEFAGGAYSFLSGGSWSPPVFVDFPFDEFVPVLLAGNEYIYAFWINPETEDSLFFSRALASEFGTSTAWEAPRRISKFVADFSVEFQDPSQIRLVYIFTGEEEERSAGIFFQRSDDGGAEFLPPINIYNSRYLRPVEADNANIQISSTTQGDRESIYVSWDDRGVNRVFLSTSADQGDTWTSPFEVDGPSVSVSVSEPFNVVVSASGLNILLLWQSNLQSGLTCTHNYVSSSDGGLTWSDRNTMLEGVIGCGKENKLFRISDKLTLLQTNINDEIFLIAWNGTLWSPLESERTLYSFTDPASNKLVSFRCRQSIIDRTGQLVVVGCDGEGIGDIWFTSREVGSVENWFPPPSNWLEPVQISEADAGIYLSQGFMDPQDGFHIFWTQIDQEEGALPEASIYYSQWIEDNISIPTRVLPPNRQSIEGFSAAIDDTRDRFLVTWNDTITGDIYSSWAGRGENPGSVFEWSDPVIVPSRHPLGHSPKLLVGGDGTIYLTYAIPINEDRGIYLVTSSDHGETWSEPHQVFNASEANWQMVDNPQIVESGDGILHAMWTQNSLFGDAGVISLVYSRSSDRGETWLQPTVVEDGAIKLSWLINLGDQQLLRLWIRSDGNQQSLFQQTSKDNGETWSATNNLTSLGDQAGFADFAFNSQHELGMVQILENGSENLSLTYHIWTNDEWTNQDTIDLGSGTISDVTSLSSGIKQDGNLVVVLSQKKLDETAGVETYRLLMTARSGEAAAPSEANPSPTTVLTTQPLETAPPAGSALPPGSTPPPGSTLPPTLASTEAPAQPTSVSLVNGEPSPTASAASVDSQTEPATAISPVWGLIIGGGLSALVVFLFLVFNRLKRP